MKKRYFEICFFPLVFFLAGGEVRTQTVEKKADSLVVSVRSPRGAMIRSAIVPGLGQLYNGKWFKAVLVFGGEAALVGNAIYQNQMAVRSRTAMEREFYLNNRSQSLWWFAGIYLLNILDAYVDAQLANFDIGPDLTLIQKTKKSVSIGICWNW